jgi:hypothetical protein
LGSFTTLKKRLQSRFQSGQFLPIKALRVYLGDAV